MVRKYLKRFVYLGITVGFVIVATYIAGTFHPNDHVITKIEDEFHKKEMRIIEELGLKEPEFEFTDKTSFINATSNCVAYLNWTTDKEKRVPISIIIAMAGIESAWGQSRFAREGNALFGVRTWDPKVPQLKPLDLPKAKFGVKTYPTKCQSVKDVIDILNNHHAYEEFRLERARQSGFVESWDYDRLIPTVALWSTNEKYVAIILEQIKARQLP